MNDYIVKNREEDDEVAEKKKFFFVQLDNIT